MALDEIFDVFHKYNKLVRRGMANPLTCNYCDTPLVTGLGSEDELVLVCVVCDSTTTPGLDTISNVRAIVQEHFA